MKMMLLLAFWGCDDGGPDNRPRDPVHVVDEPKKPFVPPPPRNNKEGHPEEVPLQELIGSFASTCVPKDSFQEWLQSLYSLEEGKIVAASMAPKGWREYISPPQALVFPTYTTISVETKQISFLGFS